MSEVSFAAVFAAGVGTAAGMLAKRALEPLAKKRMVLPRPVRAQKKEKARAAPRVSAPTKAMLAGGLIGAFLGGALFWQSASFLKAVVLAANLGSLAGWFVDKNARESVRLRKIREVAVLYESVDFYTKAGYTVQQSLRLGAVLTPLLRPSVERCLAAWPSGPAKALERFARDAGVPEAALFSSVLTHLEQSGASFGCGVLEEEGRGLEDLRKSLAELKIIAKPVYFAIYRALPLVAIGGVVVGPLVYRLIKLLQVFSGMGQ